VKTRLTPPLSPEDASRLSGAFLEDMGRLGAARWERTLFLAREAADEKPSPRPLAGWATADQAAGDLGERLESALRVLLERGRPAVILGADHPDLPERFLDLALEALAGSDLVLGPTPDGGYYLIGLNLPVPGLLSGIAWSTPRVLAETEERARALGLRVERLPEWPDVDTWEDVLALARRLAENPGAAPATRRALSALELEQRGC
jgi:rSAM/selenodomain-associated transferase 1